MPTTVHPATARTVTIPVGGAEIHGELTIPEGAVGFVVLGFPTGNTRANPKHQRLTSVLVDAGLATLFCDLLTQDEALLADMTGAYRNDVPLLADRLTAIVDWCAGDTRLKALSVGILGAGAASAATFITASRRRRSVRAIAVRGCRMDLAWSALSRLDMPVLLVTGEHDHGTREAFTMCLPSIASTDKQIALIPRAGDVFTDPLALDEYAGVVSAWFSDRLAKTEPIAGWRSEVC